MEQESHISSAIVYVKPEYIDSLVNELALMDYIEVAATSKEKGKLIVVIDTPTTQLAESTIQTIKSYRGVASTALVYHHVEPDHSLDTLIESPSSEDIL